MKKKIVSKLIAIAVILVVIVAAAFMFYSNSLKATGTSEESVIFNVESGETYYGLLSELENEDLIQSATMGKIYLKLNGISQLQANTYELNKGLSLPEIIEIVSTGDFNYLLKYKMTVPEGTTIPDVAKIVAEQSGQTKEAVISKWADEDYLKELCEDYWFLNDEEILQNGIMFPLEGYLYPETYTFTLETPSVDYITRAMLDMTGKSLEKYKTDIQNLGFTIHEFLAFASVVERESLFDEDYPKIAGVFMHRLEDGWHLESDITVLYAQQRTGINVSWADTEIDSPYNTYANPGVPIGPISNVSDMTMNSCVNYEEMDAYFFYACEDGTVLYAKTLAEHLANVSNNLWADEYYD